MEDTVPGRDDGHIKSTIDKPVGADHPRARLLNLGAAALSNSELVALVIDDADEANISRGLLSKFRSLRTLARCEPGEIASSGGLSLDNAVRLAATFELGRRASKEVLVKIKVDSPEIVCQLMAQDLRAFTRESLRVLLLDTKYQLLRIDEISVGSLNEVLAHPREVYRTAIMHSAHAIILVHNHPSGDPTPSKADETLTKSLAAAGEILGLEMLDHIIIGDLQSNPQAYYSFKEERRI